MTAANETTTEKVYNLGIIAPSVTASGNTRHEIDSEIYRLFSTGARKNRDKHVKIHVIAKRSANSAIANAVNRHHNLSVTAYNINARKGNNAAYRTAGSIAANVDGLIVLESDNTSHAPTDQAIIDSVAKREKPIRHVRIRKLFKKSHTRKPAAPPLRININNYASLADLLEAHEDQTPNDIVYCGDANDGKRAPRSPLANDYRYQPGGLKRYREKLWDAISNPTPENLEIRSALRKINEKTHLVCYCHESKPCHTDIIRSAAMYMRSHDIAKAKKVIAKELPTPQPEKVQCTSTTAKGERCKNPAIDRLLICRTHLNKQRRDRARS